MDYKGAIDYMLERLGTELPDTLNYHSLDHTLDVMNAASLIGTAEGISNGERELLLTAATYHDCGFLVTYDKHEEASCVIAGECLPKFGFESDAISMIQDMIMSTRVPQASEIHLGRILCDADLDYLGRDDYEAIAHGLYLELELNGMKLSKKKWLDIQIHFLENHQYWTDFSKRERTAQKIEVLHRLTETRAALT